MFKIMRGGNPDPSQRHIEPYQYIPLLGGLVNVACVNSLECAGLAALWPNVLGQSR